MVSSGWARVRNRVWLRYADRDMLIEVRSQFVSREGMYQKSKILLTLEEDGRSGSVGTETQIISPEVYGKQGVNQWLKISPSQ